MNPSVRVKICCISSVNEAELAIRAGADAIGLVSAMPSGPGPIEEDLIAEIARTVPPGVATFLLTSKIDAEEIVEQHHRCRTTALQLVDTLPPGSLRRLRTALPGIKLVQVIHVAGEESLRQALDIAQEVDVLLLDSGRPNAAVRELGGTGRVHDWSVSKKIVESCKVPVYLAGGLRPENVAEAIRTVRPFGVDVCSGVRVGGRLNIEKVEEFMRNALRRDLLTDSLSRKLPRGI